MKKLSTTTVSIDFNPFVALLSVSDFGVADIREKVSHYQSESGNPTPCEVEGEKLIINLLKRRSEKLFKYPCNHEIGK